MKNNQIKTEKRLTLSAACFIGTLMPSIAAFIRQTIRRILHVFCRRKVERPVTSNKNAPYEATRRITTF